MALNTILKKVGAIMIGLNLSVTVLADTCTLFIKAKKPGDSQGIQYTHLYVTDYGYDTAGIFIVRFKSGEEISLGRRSDWDFFNYICVPDNGGLKK
jgi:hypothetical protein